VQPQGGGLKNETRASGPKKEKKIPFYTPPSINHQKNKGGVVIICHDGGVLVLVLQSGFSLVDGGK
jgi:hypothetical protein